MAKHCRKCKYALTRRPVGLFDVLAAVKAGWKGHHFHKTQGKFVFC